MSLDLQYAPQDGIEVCPPEFVLDPGLSGLPDEAHQHATGVRHEGAQVAALLRDIGQRHTRIATLRQQIGEARQTRTIVFVGSALAIGAFLLALIC